MILLENITIVIEKEGDVYRAYAYNAVTLDNVAKCKARYWNHALNGLFAVLSADAHDKAESL